MNQSCLNCGAAKHGEFCSKCGQNSRDYVRSAFRIIGEVLAEVFDLHGRTFRTLTPLLFQPGHLTAEFSRGRRASYLAPGRLYLVVSLIFFTVLSLTSAPNIDFNDIAGANDEDLQELLRSLPAADRDHLVTILGERGVSIAAELESQTHPEGKSAAAAETGVSVPDDAVSADAQTELDRRFQAGASRFLEDPDGAYADLIDNLPIGLFLMLPLFALLLKGFYPGGFYAEHLVFGLHFHSFLFIVFTLVTILPEALTGDDSVLSDGFHAAVLVICLGYAYIALRVVYRQSRRRTLAKLAGLAAIYGVTLTAGLIAVFAVTVATTA